MTEEEKQLLLIDLCGRLSYNVAVHCTDPDDPQVSFISYMTGDMYHNFANGTSMFDYRPLLRPMSSMTDEERKDFLTTAGYTEEETVNGRHYEYYLSDYVGTADKLKPNYEAIDWLNKHHFDYRGLLDKGLATLLSKETTRYYALLGTEIKPAKM